MLQLKNQQRENISMSCLAQPESFLGDFEKFAGDCHVIIHPRKIETINSPDFFRASRGALGDLKQFPPWASTPKSIAWACRASHASDPQGLPALSSPQHPRWSQNVPPKQRSQTFGDTGEALDIRTPRLAWKKSQPSWIEYSWDETSQFLVKKLQEFSDKSKIPKAKPDQSFGEVWCVYTSRKRVTCYRLTS